MVDIIDFASKVLSILWFPALVGLGYVIGFMLVDRAFNKRGKRR